VYEFISFYHFFNHLYLLLTLDISREYKILKPKGQIISSHDPYGEEDWEK
jgi:hypothetical protein